MDKKTFISKKLNKDFYNDLPETLSVTMENLIQEHGDKEWFIHAWNEYRDHVLGSEISAIKMPGYIFNKYIENDELSQSNILDEDTYTEIELFEKLNDILMHSGVAHDENPPGRGSGRYPFGSGKNPYQHQTTGDFRAYVQQLKKKGLSEVDIAKGLNISTGTLRYFYSLDKDDLRREMVAYAKKRNAEGISRDQIGKEIEAKFGKKTGESSVRSLLNEEREAKMNISRQTADQLKAIVDEKRMLDVGTGTELELGITRTKLDTALEILKLEGYNIYGGNVPQATNKGQYTRLKVLARPDVEQREIYDWENIGHLSDYISLDNGDTIVKRFKYPESMNSDRLKVRFAEEGGTNKDGLVEIRRGVKDLSLGEGTHYSQVRILVDDKYYIKGMAVYGKDEDFPDGVDVIFNTNKSKEKGKLGALKSVEDNLKKDPNNPFGSSIKEGFDYPDAYRHAGQSYYIGDDGKYHLSLINKRADEGDWAEWSKELPSQMLGKQPPKTIERQLNLAKISKEEEFREIMEVTNPTIRRQMLREYADKCDRAAIDLKAAPFPGQKYQVILPLETIKDNECYAPNYQDGAELALIRYPHGGTFEIPIVKVNNRNKEGKEVITNKALDAVGISAHTAHRLSGADFDGDTVMVIPLKPDKFKIVSHDELEGLKDFDPQLEYAAEKVEIDSSGKEWGIRNGKKFPIMNETYKQRQMGIVSNLITDMTLGGANEEELAQAVRHSMVVIDAVKHKLDYKESEKVNNIQALHKKYQGHIDPKDGREKNGAATILSRAKSPQDVLERKQGAYVANDTGNILTEIDSVKKLYIDEKTGVVYTQNEKHTQYIDPKTGKKLYRNTNAIYKEVEYKDSTGKKQTAKIYEKNGELYYRDKESGVLKKVSTEKVTPKPVLQTSTKMGEADDAYQLVSGNPGSAIQESLYAEYANKMKSLANEARKEMLATKDMPYSKSSYETYKEEVDDLKAQLIEAQKNTPKERHANMIADSKFKEYKKENPHLSPEEESKKRAKYLMEARAAVGAERADIKISDKQWEAIQAGAVHPSVLEKIFGYSNKERIYQLATPRRDRNSLSKAQISRMNTLLNKGYTIEEVAKALSVSDSTIVKYSSGKE